MRRPTNGALPGRLPHARIHLPRLSADEALLVVHLLERLERAIWRAHGHAMADRLAPRRRRPAQSDLFASHDDLVPDGNPDAPDDTDF